MTDGRTKRRTYALLSGSIKRLLVTRYSLSLVRQWYSEIRLMIGRYYKHYQNCNTGLRGLAINKVGN